MINLKTLIDLKQRIGQMKALASDAVKVQSVLEQLGIKLTDDQLMLIHNKLLDLDSTITSCTEEFVETKQKLHEVINSCNHDWQDVDLVTERCTKCGAIRLDDEIFYGDENL